MRKILVIDPNNTAIYTEGLVTALREYFEVSLVTNKDAVKIDKIKNYNIFFKTSYKKQYIKGINYVISYLKIILLTYFKDYDIINIQWSKKTTIDIFFINLLKRRSKVVFTAHNILPHVNGEMYFQSYKKLYTIVDAILIHSEELKEEFKNTFPNCKTPLYVQKMGVVITEPNDSLTIDMKKIDSEIKKYDKIFLCIGLIFFNKGTDRLLKIWNDNFSNSNNLLIVAGKISQEYDALRKQLDRKSNNTIIIERKLSDLDFRTLCIKADLIILPYRHASMSGVVFSAAKAKTTVLTTDVGTIKTYLENGIDSFVVDNDDAILEREMNNIINNIDKSELKKMGEKLYSNFEIKYDWNNIVKDLFINFYITLLKESEV